MVGPNEIRPVRTDPVNEGAIQGASVSGSFLRLPVLRAVVGPLIRAPPFRYHGMKRILHPAYVGASRDLEKDTAHDRRGQGTDITSKAEGCIGSHLSVFFLPIPARVVYIWSAATDGVIFCIN
jgi:hypothetical protein